MAKKDFDTSSLLEGLTGNNEEKNNSSPEIPSRRGRKPMGKEEERISTIVRCELYDKCKTIAYIENIPIKDVVNKGLELVIGAYEKEHGTVKAKKSRKKGDINDIF